MHLPLTNVLHCSTVDISWFYTNWKVLHNHLLVSTSLVLQEHDYLKKNKKRNSIRFHVYTLFYSILFHSYLLVNSFRKLYMWFCRHFLIDCQFLSVWLWHVQHDQGYHCLCHRTYIMYNHIFTSFYFSSYTTHLTIWVAIYVPEIRHKFW